jgi:hypothetical protein
VDRHAVLQRLGQRVVEESEVHSLQQEEGRRAGKK